MRKKNLSSLTSFFRNDTDDDWNTTNGSTPTPGKGNNFSQREWRISLFIIYDGLPLFVTLIQIWRISIFRRQIHWDTISNEETTSSFVWRDIYFLPLSRPLPWSNLASFWRGNYTLTGKKIPPLGFAWMYLADVKHESSQITAQNMNHCKLQSTRLSSPSCSYSSLRFSSPDSSFNTPLLSLTFVLIGFCFLPDWLLTSLLFRHLSSCLFSSLVSSLLPLLLPSSTFVSIVARSLFVPSRDHSHSHRCSQRKKYPITLRPYSNLSLFLTLWIIPRDSAAHLSIVGTHKLFTDNLRD